VEVGDLVVTGTEFIETFEQENGQVDWSRVKGNLTKLVKSDKPYQHNLIGVVSDNYQDFVSTGYNIRPEDNPTSIALAGRVLVNVTDENGPIAPGDPLTSSSILGHAMKATAPSRVIGLALGVFDPTRDNPDVPATGQIMVFVNPHWWHPDMATQSAIDDRQLTVNELMVDTLTVREAATFEKHLTVKGDLIVEGLIRADGEVRGAMSVPAASSSVTVFWSREAPPAALTATPTWNTTVWVSDLTSTGATINFGSPPTAALPVYWIAID
jgi:hypothetical protein